MLSLEVKIELLSKLTDSIKADVSSKPESNKEELLEDLFGAWADMEEDVTELIYSSRTISDRPINLD